MVHVKLENISNYIPLSGVRMIMGDDDRNFRWRQAQVSPAKEGGLDKFERETDSRDKPKAEPSRLTQEFYSQANDVFISDLHEMLPKDETYDGDFLQSHLYLPVPLYFVPATVCKIVAYVLGTDNLPVSLLELFFVTLVFLPMFARHVMRKMDPENGDHRHVLLAHFPVYPHSGTAVFVTDKFWRMTKFNMNIIPELPSFPIYFNGGAPFNFVCNIPLLSALFLGLSIEIRPIVDPLLFCTVWSSSLGNLLFAFSSAWFPTPHGINLVKAEVGKLDHNVASVREKIIKASSEAGMKWHIYNWEHKIATLSYYFSFFVASMIVLLYFLIVSYGADYVGERDLKVMFGSARTGTKLVVTIIVCWLTIFSNFASLIGFYFADLRSCIQTIVLRQQYLSDMLDTDNITTIASLCKEHPKDIVWGLETWMVARNFIEKYDCNFPFTSMSCYFGMQLIFAGVGILGVLLLQLLNRGIPVYSVLYWMFVITSLFCTMSAFISGYQVVSINKAMERQQKLVQDHITAVRFDLNPNYADLIKGGTKEDYIAYLERLAQRIEDEHMPPKVLGIDVRPTLFNVFQGYVVTGISAILVQYISTKFGGGGR